MCRMSMIRSALRYLISMNVLHTVGGGEIRVNFLHMLLGKRILRFLKNGQLLDVCNTVGKTIKISKIMQLWRRKT